jgi:hypothetical protein
VTSSFSPRERVGIDGECQKLTFVSFVKGRQQGECKLLQNRPYVGIPPQPPLRRRAIGKKDANASYFGEHMKGLKESKVSNIKPETYTK